MVNKNVRFVSASSAVCVWRSQLACLFTLPVISRPNERAAPKTRSSTAADAAN